MSIRNRILYGLAEAGACNYATELHAFIEGDEDGIDLHEFLDLFEILVREGLIISHDPDFDEQAEYWLSEKGHIAVVRMRDEGMD